MKCMKSALATDGATSAAAMTARSTGRRRRDIAPTLPRIGGLAHPRPGRHAGRGRTTGVAHRPVQRRWFQKMERSGGITPGLAVQIIGIYTVTIVTLGALLMWLIDEDNFNYGIALGGRRRP